MWQSGRKQSCSSSGLTSSGSSAAASWKMALRWRDHRALGRAGGAGGVDQGQHVVGGLLLQFRLEAAGFGGLGRLPHGDEIIVEDHGGIREIAQAVAVEDDDLGQRRHLVADFQPLVELLVVLDEKDLGSAVLDKVGELPGAVGGVDAVGDGA